MQEYRYKFYLNVMHSIKIDDYMGEVHPHTWEIVVDLFKQNNGFIAFSEVEKMVDVFLRPYQNKNMNNIPPFDAINPTLENVTMYLQKELGTTFIAKGFIMSRILVSETPSRSFIIDITNRSPQNDIGSFNSIFNSKFVEDEANDLLTQITPGSDLNVEDSEFDEPLDIHSPTESPKKFMNLSKKHWILIVTAIIVLSSCYVIIITRG